ncbi:hypothetical protein BGX24_000992 [Mortierella sp. AD032]|nr:hypothetical protein BGX24_000992 [Mortierella sp. AD032]
MRMEVAAAGIAAHIHAHSYSGSGGCKHNHDEKTGHAADEKPRNAGVAGSVAESSENGIDNDDAEIGNAAAMVMTKDYPPVESEDAENLEIFENPEIPGMPENHGKSEGEETERSDDPDDPDDPESLVNLGDADVCEHPEDFDEAGDRENPEKSPEDSEEAVTTGGGGQKH